MNLSQPHRPQAGLETALERIALERVARSGRLDLGNLGLQELPVEILELDWLVDLRLGGVSLSLSGTPVRRSEAGDWEHTDETCQPNRVDTLVRLRAHFEDLDAGSVCLIFLGERATYRTRR